MDIKEIHSPADIKGLSASELVDIAKQFREALLFKLSQHGGHVGPNLGMVEATIQPCGGGGRRLRNAL